MSQPQWGYEPSASVARLAAAAAPGHPIGPVAPGAGRARAFGGDLAPPEVDKWAGDEVMAHEFGHAVQGRSGILASKNWLRSEAPSNSASLQIARRNETQADCLAGIFVRSVSRSLGLQQTDVAAIEDGFASGGDDVVTGKKGIEGNHGLAGTRRYWGATGLTTSAIGKCNTYVAPDNLVR